MNGEFIDGRGMLGAKPHFENAVYAGGTIWTVATVGNEYDPVQPGAMNKIRVVALGKVSGNWTVTQSILQDSGLTAKPSSVFAPSIWASTGAPGGGPSGVMVLVVAQRVGVKSHLELVISGRAPGDPANTLRPWSGVRANPAINFQPLDQPIPYYFGRITGVTSSPQNGRFAIVWTEPDTSSGTVGSMGGSNTATGDWETWVATFEDSELPS